jgi:hypothetical protein
VNTFITESLESQGIESCWNLWYGYWRSRLAVSLRTLLAFVKTSTLHGRTRRVLAMIFVISSLVASSSPYNWIWTEKFFATNEQLDQDHESRRISVFGKGWFNRPRWINPWLGLQLTKELAMVVSSSPATADHRGKRFESVFIPTKYAEIAVANLSRSSVASVKSWLLSCT